MSRYKNIKLSYIIANIKRRCSDPNNPAYKNYGARGITVCSEWRYKSGSFIKWALANGYEHGLEIDRKNNDGNYCPENCRFVTKKVNLNNKRGNKLIYADGVSNTVAELVDKTGITRSSIKHRLTHGWDVNSAISEPTRPTQTMITYNGVSKSISEWAKESGIPVDTFWRRLFVHKWTMEKAIETPLQKGRVFEFNGIKRTTKEWAKNLSVDYDKFRKTLQRKNFDISETVKYFI